MRQKIITSLSVIILFCGFSGCSTVKEKTAGGVVIKMGINAQTTMNISLPGIVNGFLPTKYSCDGAGLSPTLEISGVPPSAKSLVLHVVDYDVPKNLKPDGTFHHWILMNINPTTTTIAENTVPSGAVPGKNSAGRTSWVPACPPSGSHRYTFQLFALNRPLDLPAGTDVQKILDTLKPYEVAKTETVGRYTRQK